VRAADSGIAVVANNQRLVVFGFRIGQLLQQSVVLMLISRPIAFRLNYQPSIACQVLFVDVTLH
jgi:hypothetical protein